MTVHTYEVAATLDDGGATIHLSCPDCSKEVLRTLGAPGEPGERTTRRGYRVLRDADGNLLQGDFTAQHRWAQGMHLDMPGVVT